MSEKQEKETENKKEELRECQLIVLLFFRRFTVIAPSSSFLLPMGPQTREKKEEKKRPASFSSRPKGEERPRGVL